MFFEKPQKRLKYGTWELGVSQDGIPQAMQYTNRILVNSDNYEEIIPSSIYAAATDSSAFNCIPHTVTPEFGEDMQVGYTCRVESDGSKKIVLVLSGKYDEMNFSIDGKIEYFPERVAHDISATGRFVEP